ncbi:hypothetical protein INT47_013165 [Mucor saturninus]|uniref:RING-type domain-containing protein n=1 Tax=Mucor saturninus TaxID=64648 RepID=A0A8H7UUF0_9FUNG|nr:hypothetical protein INT47_013165 [Mucor saturninus]
MKSQVNLIVNSLKDELTSLCQDVFEKPQALLPCLHTFCLECVSSIPRATVSRYTTNYALQNIIDIFKKAEDYSLEELLDRSTSSTPTRTIESLNIDGPSGESSSSSSPPEITNTKKPCRSCRPINGTGYICDVPITDTLQNGFGHIFCGYCSEYLPARGPGGNEPALNQCCSFCGVVACDKYWVCKNRGKEAKLYILSEISAVEEYIKDVEVIDTLADGHLNHSEIRLLKDYLDRSRLTWNEAWATCLSDFNDNHYTTAIARRLTPLAQQLYNTRRLVNFGNSSTVTDVDEEDDQYYDRMGEDGILPSEHLHACYGCAVTVVNGQFYGFWKEVVENGLQRDLREKCPHGTFCESQWRTEGHAERLSHIETEGTGLTVYRNSSEFYEIYDDFND